MKKSIYRFLVNRVPAIRRKYQEERKNAATPGSRLLLIGKLFLWNLEYYFLGGKEPEGDTGFPEKTKLLFHESQNFKGIDQENLVEQLAAYDVVSFDVFDTLLLRPFSSPADLFYLAGTELHYPDFPTLRMLAEEQARKRKKENSGTGEVILKEIWECLEPLTGISPETGMSVEIAMEERYCLGNPYFLPVLKFLKEKNKGILAVSDMYLDSSFIRNLLEKFYGPVFYKVLVSAETGCSKAEGDLYKKVHAASIEFLAEKEGSLRKPCLIAHIGDNPHSDILMAEKNKIDPFLYPNPQEIGNAWRAFDMSRITGGIYRGLVNLRFHTGARKYSVFYELGYIYGGLAALGFCQFIHRKTAEWEIGPICFLARDGDILKQVYDLLYPGSRTCYLLWSRNVSARLAAERFPFDFFQRFLFQKIHQGYSIEKIFASMKLAELTDEVCRALKCGKDSILTEKKAIGCRNFLLKQWKRVVAAYKEEQKLAGRYLWELLSPFNEQKGQLKKITFVDIGWAGSGPLGLEYVLHKTLGLSWQVYTLLAGSSGASSPDRDSSQGFFFENRMDSYFFSQKHNRDLWKFHDLHKKHNLYTELLFTSPSPGFLGFGENPDRSLKFLFAPEESHQEEIRKIHSGILDFVKDYQKYFGNYLKKDQGEISGRDAYGPLALLLKDTGFQKKLEKAFFWDVHENVE